MSKTKSANGGSGAGERGALMNNLVHIPKTPTAQRERKKGMKRGREMRQVENERWTEEGKIKAGGKVRDE